jgi:carbon-monoxide dehydrogenase small subunit
MNEPMTQLDDPNDTPAIALESVWMIVNGQIVQEHVEPRLLLSDFLRDHLRLTGTHVGCEHGVCGACTILVDGHSVRSCLVLTVRAHGAEIKTVESMGTIEALSAQMNGLTEDNLALRRRLAAAEGEEEGK